MRVAVLLVAAACYSPAPPAGAPCGPNDACPTGLSCIDGFCGGGAGTDGAVIAPDELVVDMVPLCATWTAEHFDPCTLPMPLGDLNLVEALSGYTWDTDDGELTGRMNTPVPVTTTVLAQPDGPDVLLASVENFTMEANTELNINGARPLLIAVWGTATISGDIDASAAFGTPGPGGSSGITATCGSTPTGNSGDAGMPSTGGGGGAYQGGGGNGGNEALGGGDALSVPMVIRGGCSGGLGGPSTSAVTAPRGAGGGAIQISARLGVTVTVSGDIDAGGGGGNGGRAPYGGGGGGGAGGYIGIDAPTVTMAGALVANGGGGGGGASESTNGTSGNISTTTSAAVGGAGAATSTIGTCVKGGDGSSVSVLAGQNAGASPCGGGGGGGGAGYILIWSPTRDITGTISPPPLDGP